MLTAQSTRNGRMPLYRQLKDELLNLVTRRNLKPGDCFFSLDYISNHYNVSMITSRKAVSELRQAGFLSTARGRKSTIIKCPAVNKNKYLQQKNIAVFFRPLNPERSIDYDVMPWTSSIYSALQQKLTCDGFRWSVIPVKEEAFAIENAGMLIQDNRTGYDAFVCLSEEISGDLLSALEASGKPYVTIKPPTMTARFNYVEADYYSPSRRLGEYMADKGIKTFIFLSAPHAKNEISQKLRGFQEALLYKKINMRKFYIVMAECYRSFPYNMMHKILTSPETELPAGIYTSGDGLALAAIDLCRKSGLRVPENVSVVGSTGLKESADSEPPLTVIKGPLQEIGHAVVAMLTEMLEKQTSHLEPMFLTPELIMRKSLL